jgi:hypothetical protein
MVGLGGKVEFLEMLFRKRMGCGRTTEQMKCFMMDVNNIIWRGKDE